MTDPQSQEAAARRIMDGFAVRTGIAGDRPQRRYLWTDAYAVCNYLTLFLRTGEERFAGLARTLIDAVHQVLGRHREVDAREGWLSGLVDAELHPTAGGLRIGKPLPERRPDEPADATLEWDRDGQYYHYLTRWMHALGRASVVLEDPRMRSWAIELAQVAHDRFVYVPAGGSAKRMYWKMSIDLTRPLVRSQGAHDPLDGLVTALGLHAPELEAEVDDLFTMAHPTTWPTDDPLGIGGLLTDAWRVAQLLDRPPVGWRDRLEGVLSQLLDASVVSLDALARRYPFRQPIGQRLAFRELGLAIGLSATGAMLDAVGQPTLPVRLARTLEEYLPMAESIRSTWLSPAAQATAAWQDHEDIDAVMLATALLPDELIRA